jgi:AAA domain (dynein-related subfamily)
MSKKSKQRYQSSPRFPSPAPSSTGGAPATLEAPISAEQGAEVERYVAAAQELDVEVPPPGPPPPELTFVQALNQVRQARDMFDAARRKHEEAKSGADQERRALEQQRADGEQALKKQREDLARQEADLRRQGDALDERETKLIDRDLHLGEREHNAEAGFLDERRRMLADLEKQVAALRGEKESLEATAAALRSAEETAWRTRLGERADRWRREEDARSMQWQQEDEARARAATGERHRLAEELAKRVAEHRAQLKAEDDALEPQRRTIDEGRRLLRVEQLALATERELLDEERTAFQRKVERFAAAKVAELEADLHAERERSTQAAAQRDLYFRDLEAHREIERRFAGQTPEQVLDRVRQLEQEAGELRAKVGASLGEASARRLAELEKERSAWLDDKEALHAKVSDADARLGRLRIAAVELETLRDRAEALETTRRLLEAALKDLRAEVDSYTQADEKRNPMDALLKIDADNQVEPPTRPVPPLADFARSLRPWIAKSLGGRPLYYEERDVRCFLGGLAMSRLVLLQGISGTGKTSLPLAFAAAIQAGSAVVEVQAGWRDRQDLVGYYNAFHRHFYATNFLQALYKAGTPAYRDRPFLIVLDEINLSRVEQFFADFLSALEQPKEEERRITLLSDPIAEPPALMVEGRHLPIPPNVWFVGTANHDETTTEFADKTYDRAHVMELPRRDPKQVFDLRDNGRPHESFSHTALTDAFDMAQQTRRAEVKTALAWLQSEQGIAPLLSRRFRVGWGNRLERDVERFVPVVVEAGGTVSEAMDHIVSTKILRKLRDRHDVRADGLDELRATLLASWTGIGGDPRSTPERSIKLIDQELLAKRDGAPSE